MKKILIFSFVCLFLLVGNLNFVSALSLNGTNIEKIYLAVCNSPEQIGLLDEVLKVYDVNKVRPIVMTSGMCWVPGQGVFPRSFSLIETKRVNGRNIKLVLPSGVVNKINVDIPSWDYLDYYNFKVIPVTGYVYWKTDTRFLVCCVVEVEAHLKDKRILLGYRDPDWNGDIVAFRNAKLLEEAKYFK